MIPFSQALLDSFPAGAIVCDADLHVRQVNAWLAARLPQPVTSYLNRPLGEAFPELAERSLLAAYDYVVQQHESLHLPMDIHRYFLKLPAPEGSELSEMAQSASLAPILEDGQLLGVLTLISDQTQRRNTELQLQREIDKLTALHEIDQALATLDLRACLQVIAERTRALFRAENSVLMLAENGRLHVAADDGYDPSHVGDTIELSQGVCGWVVRNRRSTLVADVRADERYMFIDPRARSEIAAPLLLHADCLGVINVESERLAAFGESDLELLELLAARAAAAIHNARLHELVNEQRLLANNLRDITLSLSNELNPDAILDVLLDHVAGIVPFDSASIMELDPVTRRLRMMRHRGYEQFGVAGAVANFEWQIDEMKAMSQVAQAMTPMLVADVRVDPDWVETSVTAHIGSWAGAPIVARGKLLGILSLDKQERGFYTPELAARLMALAAAAGLAWENARLYAEQEQLATTDGLTGIANRRQFDQVLTRELSRAERFQRPLTLGMADLDDFKRFNDTYGHPAGDEVLRSVARILAHTLRAMDTPARYGGEEFAIVLPESSLEEACAVAERLRAAVEAQAKAMPGWPTISIGLALAPRHGRTAAELVRSADSALYRAKRAGKNRLMAA